MHVFTSIDDTESMSQHDLETIENYSVSPSPEETMIDFTKKQKIRTILDLIASKAITENEIECLKGINLLFSNINELDFLNKRAVMLYLREITSLSPKQLSVVLSLMKKHYKLSKQEYEQEE